MKRIFHWFRKGTRHKYVNGGKGVISIFLAAIMLPFLSLADFLVETARYHDAVAVLNGAMDSAALSALSHYDDYLLDRFGLAAVSQEKSVKSTYTAYLTENLKSYASWDINNVKAFGDLKLSDKDLLMQEIAEVSKFSAPTALAGDFLIAELNSLLKDLSQVKMFNKWADAFSSAGDSVDSFIFLKEALDDFERDTYELKSAIERYDENYAEFDSAIWLLSERVASLNEAEAAAKEEEELDYSQVIWFWKNRVYHAKMSLLNARQAYAGAIMDLITALERYQESADYFLNSIKEMYHSSVSAASSFFDASQYGMGDKRSSLKKDKESIDKELKNAGMEDRGRLEAQKYDIELQMLELDRILDNRGEAGDAMENMAEHCAESLYRSMSSYRSEDIARKISQLKNLRTNVLYFQPDQVTENYSYLVSRYYIVIRLPVNVVSVETMFQVLETLLHGDPKRGTDIWTTISAISTVFRSLFSVNGVYDSRLNAYLQTGLSGYADSEIDLVLRDISDLMKEMDRGKGMVGIINILTQLKNIITIFIRLFIHIAQYLSEIALSVTALLSEILAGNVGDKVLLDEYLIKSLPNRTSISASGSFESEGHENRNVFTGYSFEDIPLRAPGRLDLSIVPAADAIVTLTQLVSNISSGGSDRMFVAAEAEYIIAGSRSEIMNQAVVFMNLYFMRMILNIVTILADAEIQKIAEAAASATCGIGGIIVIACYLLAEPLLDTVFLVNGKEVPAIKTKAYLTPSGLSELLSNLTNLNIANEGELKNLAKNTFGKNLGTVNKFAEKTGFLNWKYDNYLFVQMLLFGRSEVYLSRLQSLICIEANAYYGKKNFTLEKSYMNIKGSVDAQYDPVLPIKALADRGMFRINQTRARGY